MSGSPSGSGGGSRRQSRDQPLASGQHSRVSSSGQVSSGSPAGGAQHNRVPSGSSPTGGQQGGQHGRQPSGGSRASSGSPSSSGSNIVLKLDTRNLDLGIDAQQKASNETDVYAGKVVRPKSLSTLGVPVKVGLNAFQVKAVPKKPVFMYDVQFKKGNQVVDDPNPRIRQRIWDSRPVQARLKIFSDVWIYDGKRLAWCNADAKTLEIVVDLKQEAEYNEQKENRTPSRPSKGGSNSPQRSSPLWSILIRCARTVKFDQLSEHFAGKASWGQSCLDSMVTMDHIMRESCRRNMIISKRSAFWSGDKVKPGDLDTALEVRRGVYTALRAAYFGPGQSDWLVVNADVVQGAFWKKNLTLLRAMTLNTGLTDEDRFASQLMAVLEKPNFAQDHIWQQLNTNFRHTEVVCHAGTSDEKIYKIDKFVRKRAQNFEFKTDNDQMITMQQYFREKFNFNPRTDLPLVQTTSKINGEPIYLPIDRLKIAVDARYKAMLNSTQMQKMLEFAVCWPAQRWDRLMSVVNGLRWGSDPYLNTYGVLVNPNRVEVVGRQLVAPSLKFGQSRMDGKTIQHGRWRLDGTKFVRPTKRKVKSWGIMALGGHGAPQPADLKNFSEHFVKIYRGHGGQLPDLKAGAAVTDLSLNWPSFQEAYGRIAKVIGERPDLLLVFLPRKEARPYRLIKHWMETVFGCVSQCILNINGKKNQGPTISNICMKLHAKLGGLNWLASSSFLDSKFGAQSPTTMIIGADVTHPTNMQGESISCVGITMSSDQTLAYFPAFVATNGDRTEMIRPENIEALRPYIERWVRNSPRQRLPDRVIYLRDGLGSSQYSICRREEIDKLKKLFHEIDPHKQVKITALIASKRHHVRFWPLSNADGNGNPKPGLLVETGVTSPADLDFYLCSHVAIKGTARPVHYYCLLNEAGLSSMDMQQLCFEHSFQYQRSSTPTSQPPATYYAHLAAERALCHLDPRYVPDPTLNQNLAPGERRRVRPLTPMKTQFTPFHESMWYI